MAKELHHIIREAEAEGWVVTNTRGGHVKLRGPEGQLVFAGSTPGDRRAAQNLRSRLARARRGQKG